MSTYTIPDDWDLTNPTTWTLQQTVDAHMGYHKTGAIMREYEDIRLSASDLDASGDLPPAIDPDDPDDDTPERRAELRQHAEWWADVLQGIMAGKIATAEASPEQIERAAQALGVSDLDDYLATHGDDLESEATAYRVVVSALAK